MQPFLTRNSQEYGEAIATNCCRMQRTVALILVMTFFVAQYERHVSYVQCKLANYFNNTGKQCDCEKILGQKPGPEQQAPLTHNHLHIDETYIMPASEAHVHQSFSINGNHTPVYTASTAEGVQDEQDRPPRFN